MYLGDMQESGVVFRGETGVVQCLGTSKKLCGGEAGGVVYSIWGISRRRCSIWRQEWYLQGGKKQNFSGRANEASVREVCAPLFKSPLIYYR